MEFLFHTAPFSITGQTQSTDQYPTTKYAEIFCRISFSIVSNLLDNQRQNLKKACRTLLFDLSYIRPYSKKKKIVKKYLTETSFQICWPHCFTFIPYFSEQELKLIKKKLILVHVKQASKRHFLVFLRYIKWSKQVLLPKRENNFQSDNQTILSEITTHTP